MKILIAYDGSPAADAALKDLRNAGLPDRAEARVLNVVPAMLPLDYLAPTDAAGPAYRIAYKDAVERQKALEKHALAKAERACRDLAMTFPGWKLTACTVVDTASDAILDMAESWRADLIALGSRGWSEFGKLVIGSVADKVLNHARCSVRVGRPRKSRTPGKRKAPVVLIAYDGSPYADAAVATAADRAWPKGTRAQVLAVSEFELRMGDLYLSFLKALGHARKGTSPWPWMEARLKKAAEKLSAAGLLVETAVEIGEPRASLIEQAARLKADTVFLGSRGRTGLRRVMLGSVSASVAAHAPCSVEIVHPGKGKKS